jgi:hypothetical protein
MPLHQVWPKYDWRADAPALRVVFKMLSMKKYISETPAMQGDVAKASIILNR